MCIAVAHLPSGGSHILHILQVPGCNTQVVGMTGQANIHTEYKLWVSFSAFAEVNGPTKADDRKIIMVNSSVAFGFTNISGSGLDFYKIPCDRERQKLRLIAFKLAKPPNLKPVRVCSDHFLKDD